MPDFLEDALPDHGSRLAEVSAAQRFHLVDVQVGVVEGHQGRFGSEAGNASVGEAPKLDHVGSENVDIAHGDGSLVFSREAGRSS